MKRSVLLLLVLIAAVAAKAQVDPPGGYHAGDYNWLYDYVSDNEEKFGIGQDDTYSNFDDWFLDTTNNGVIWNSDSEGRIKQINFTSKGLTGSLDVSGLAGLNWLDCNDNLLEELEVPSGVEHLDCSFNKLTALDVSNAVGMTYLACNNNLLEDLKFPSGLTFLFCWDNKLKELDVAPLTKLVHLSCERNMLTVLDVAPLTELIILACRDNQISVLDVKGLLNLTHLDCTKNKLKKLEVADLVDLVVLGCWGNELTTLDVEGLDKLWSFFCSDNKLTELTVTSTELVQFQCQRNRIPFSKLPIVEVKENELLEKMNDRLSQSITHPVSVRPGQEVKLESMVIDGEETIVRYNGTEIATLTTGNPSFTIPSDWAGKVELKMSNTAFEESMGNDPKVIKYTFNVSVVTYQSVTLEVAPGFTGLNYTPGTITVAIGDHLYLAFRTENPAVTTGDILFLVDGVEQPLRYADGQFSYTLNPVNDDHTLLLAMKEYTVTLTETEGVTFSVGAGTHNIAYGEPFSFGILLDDAQDTEAVQVLVNGIQIAPDPLRATTLTYTIDKVTGPVTVTVEGVDPVANQAVETGIRIYGADGQAVVETATPQTVQVYSLTGVLRAARTVSGRESFTLPRGIYIVKAGRNVAKVMVR